MKIIKWIRQMEQLSGVYTGSRTRLWNTIIRSPRLDKLTEETENLLQSVVRMRTRHIFGLLLCYVECVLFAGQIFGWASLVYVLKNDDIFGCEIEQNSTLQFNDQMISELPSIAHSTINANVTSTVNEPESIKESCETQDQKLNLSFMLYITIYGLLSFPAGVLFDKFGIRFTRLTAMGIYVPAALMVAFADTASSWLIYLAAPLIGTMCSMMIIANIHVCALAGRHQSTMTTTMSGALQVSTATYLIVKVLWDVGIPRVYSFCGLAALSALVVVNTFCFLPAYKAVNPDPAMTPEVKDYNPNHDVIFQTEGSLKQDSSAEKTQVTQHPSSPRDSLSRGKCSRLPSAAHTIMSPMFLVYLLWYVMLHVRLQTFVGGANMWFIYVLDNDLERVSRATNIYAYCDTTAILIAPLVGLLIDHRMSKIKGNSQSHQAAAAVPSITIATTISVLLGISTIAPVESLIYVSMMSTILNRIFLYGTAMAFLHLSFPSDEYGVLVGFTFFWGGLFSFLIQPLLLWGQSAGFQSMNTFLLVLSLCSYVFPVYVEVTYRRACQ